MSFTRASLARGTAYVAYNSVNLFPQGAIDVKRLPTWDTVMSGMFGPIDKFKKDLTFKIPLRLWGAYENLGVLFPSYIMNPIPGTSVFGATDVPLVIQGRDGTKITYVSAQLTKLANLYLGVDSDLFAADVEFTALIGNGLTPETASSYSTIGTATYSDATAAFAKTNYSKTRFTAAWGSITGFTAIAPQKGIAVGWDAQFTPVPMDGYGTVDYTVKSLIATASLIGVGPTPTQIKTNSQEEAVMGVLGSTISADLVCTGANSGPVITLKGAFLKESGIIYDADALRVGGMVFESTRGFASGVAAVVAGAA